MAQDRGPTTERRVGELHGIGPYMVRMLAEIDVHTVGALRQLGAVEAFARLRFIAGKRITLNALYAIDGALTGIDWRDIPPARKAALLAEWRRRSAEG
jgi:DNA transformation protein